MKAAVQPCGAQNRILGKPCWASVESAERAKQAGNRVATVKTSFEGFIFISVKLSFQVLCCVSSV